MSALEKKPSLLPYSQSHAIESTCSLIAPTWPLDQMIAVNPWWELKDQAFASVSARLAALAQVSCLMPKQDYKRYWGNSIQEQHLLEAARELESQATLDQLLEHLDTPEQQGQWLNISDWLDAQDDRYNRMAWCDEITHQISQTCAEFFQTANPGYGAQTSLYKQWLTLTRRDRGIEILMAEDGLREQFEQLPNERDALFEEAIAVLAADRDELDAYFHALLLDINGWASWVAYHRWQATLDGVESSLMQDLLAIRLSWELVLWKHYQKRHPEHFKRLNANWLWQWPSLGEIIETHRAAQAKTWVWQRALELSYQKSLHQKLTTVERASAQAPSLQAVFCIDVRSEPMRRALECQDAAIETKGFAGFFGLPLEYQPTGTRLSRPQLPGLLRSQVVVTEADDGKQGVSRRIEQMTSDATRYSTMHEKSPATLSLVESCGVAYGFKLLKDTFFAGANHHPVNHLPRAPTYVLSRDGQPIPLEERAEMAKAVLSAMGLTATFAETILLVGHGSDTCNNPHAAGLDCGACGGQTGEVNVRVLAGMLNDTNLRKHLANVGIHIPDKTVFVPALHNTTTDDIRLLEELEDSGVRKWLRNASVEARHERAKTLGIDPNQESSSITKRIRARGRDWSQTRPEWGLANNAAFIVAPRSMTRNIDLQGRSFLHDYDWQSDREFLILELIMTAPMIVTHWINMQYNASVSDNQKYGSGNKVLHNVVGGNIGVFEGNGGDLRIGLSRQSLHNGERWMHEIQRLNVYLAAPKDAIASIVERHESVAQLINHDWLYVYQWDLETRQISRYYRDTWIERWP